MTDNKPLVHEDIASQILSVKSMIKSMRQVEKHLKKAAKASKVAFKKQKRELSEEEKERRRASSGFNKPVEVSQKLKAFLGLGEGEKISRINVTKEIIAYVKGNDLQKGRNFDADEKLIDLLGEPIHLLNTKQPELGNGYSYFSLPKYLNPHFIKK